MKPNKKTFGICIFAALALLLFFSKTISGYNRPEVTGARPERGGLSKLELSSGLAVRAETENIYAVAAGAVGRVYVKEGEPVSAGQILFEMDFEIPPAERKLFEIQNNIEKLEADIRGLRSRLDNIKKALAAVEEEDADLSGQAGLIVLEIEKARIGLEHSRLNFEFGSSSKNDLVTAENNLKSLFFKYEAEIGDLEASLAVKFLDLQNLRLAEEGAREIVEDYRNNKVVRAPRGGTLLSLPAEKGKHFPEKALLASIGVGREFTVDCTVSLDNNFVKAGDTCELSNSSHILKGTVTRVKPSAQGKTVSISVITGNLDDGESFDITGESFDVADESFDIAFEKNSAASFTLVPNGAVNQDSDGYFVYQIKRRKGIMGEEYYLERLDIFPGDSDHRNTAVIRGISFFEPIVLAGDQALSPGITVSLKNAEDFFEN